MVSGAEQAGPTHFQHFYNTQAAAPDFQPGKQEPPQATQPPPDAGAECDENVFVHTGECALSTKQSKQPQSATSSAGKSNENIKADVFKRSASSANTGGA